MQNTNFTMNTECGNTFERHYTILSSDVDSNYMVTSASLLKDCQDCVINIMSQKHLAPFDLKKREMYWVITEQSLQFTDSKAVWGDEITFLIHISAMTPVRIFLDFKAKITDGRYFAEGYTVWSVLENKNHRPVVLDPLIRFDGQRSEENRRTGHFTAPTSGTPVNRMTYQIKMTDLDISGHVGSAGYLRLAVNTMSKEDIRDYEPEMIHMKFNLETYLDDILTCHLFREESGSGVPETYAVIENGGNQPACQIYCTWKPVAGKEYNDFVQEFRREHHS